MKRILSPANAPVLARFAGSRVLLAFDFDGTLAPIVSRRDRARMRAATRSLLAAVCKLYPCAVISGRARADVARRTSGVGLKYVLGSHGAEPSPHAGRFERQIARVRPRLAEALSHLAGVDIEDKRISLAVHYRRASDPRLARATINEAVAELGPNLRLIPGKLVVNVLPEGAPHKGQALVRLRARERAQTTLYVGDDDTDEDVFELAEPERLLSIRVGRSRKSAAAYYLRDQHEMDAFLRQLVALRSGSGRGKRRGAR